MRFKLLLEGYSPEFFFGAYNGYAQEILDPESALYKFKPDVIIVLTRIEEVIPGFDDAFGSKSPAAWHEVIRSAALGLLSLSITAGERAASQVIMQNMVLSSSYWGIYDAQTSNGQAFLAAGFNEILASKACNYPNLFIWDFSRLVETKGYESFYDPKLWFTARNPYRQSAYVEIGRDLCKHLLSALGRVKKCVVVDLDNTLWGGLAGEDGLDGVKLGHDYPGNCYLAFQKGLLKLYDRGIILAVYSKNNETDALEIIDQHPYMALRRKHFAALRINWEDKATNMQELAAEINIGLESIIFIDD
ncbi:MAG: HAD-IIIC family phosphatase, partial [Gammaproteobacteria bacterium]